jgi:predicted transcriptional regulator
MSLKTPTGEKTIVSFQASRDLADRLAERAHADDRSVSSLVRQAVVAHLARENEKEN